MTNRKPTFNRVAAVSNAALLQIAVLGLEVYQYIFKTCISLSIYIRLVCIYLIYVAAVSNAALLQIAVLGLEVCSYTDAYISVVYIYI